MFPDSRGVLLVFSPVLALFFVAFAYSVHGYVPISLGERIWKALFLEILSSFLVLCCLGFVAGIIGPNHIRPVITRVGIKAALAGMLIGIPLTAGFILLVFLYFFST